MRRLVLGLLLSLAASSAFGAHGYVPGFHHRISKFSVTKTWDVNLSQYVYRVRLRWEWEGGPMGGYGCGAWQCRRDGTYSPTGGLSGGTIVLNATYNNLPTVTVRGAVGLGEDEEGRPDYWFDVPMPGTYSMAFQWSWWGNTTWTGGRFYFTINPEDPQTGEITWALTGDTGEEATVGGGGLTVTDRNWIENLFVPDQEHVDTMADAADLLKSVGPWGEMASVQAMAEGTAQAPRQLNHGLSWGIKNVAGAGTEIDLGKGFFSPDYDLRNGQIDHTGNDPYSPWFGVNDYGIGTLAGVVKTMLLWGSWALFGLGLVIWGIGKVNL